MQTGCSDAAFLTKFNAQGNGLVYSTCLGSGLGGAYGAGAHGVALDATGTAYLTGWGGGSGTHFLPTTPGAFQSQPSPSIGPNAFVAVLNPSASGSASLLYATYFGGVSTNFGGDLGAGIAVDAFGMLYITGQTSSPNFPVTAGAFLTTFLPGSCSGFVCNAEYNGGKLPTVFVAKLNPRASGAASLIYSTFLGGSAGAKGLGIAVDNTGNAYVTGCTACTGGDLGSIPFPTTPGAYQSVSTFFDAFVTKLNAAGDGLVYSTLLGGSMGTPISYGTAIALDSSGDAYVTGYTRATNFPTTPDAFQGSYPGGGGSLGYNAFLTKLNATGTALIYSSYLGGGTHDDYLSRLAVDTVGDAYVMGYTGSADFPTTQATFQLIYSGNGDTFVTKFPLGSATGFAVSGILPNNGGNSGVVTATIIGAEFQDGVSVSLGGGAQPVIPGSPVNVAPERRTITATFDLHDAVPGPRDLIVTNQDGTTITLSHAFTITEVGVLNVWVQIVGDQAFAQGPMRISMSSSAIWVTSMRWEFP